MGSEALISASESANSSAKSPITIRVRISRPSGVIRGSPPRRWRRSSSSRSCPVVTPPLCRSPTLGALLARRDGEAPPVHGPVRSSNVKAAMKVRIDPTKQSSSSSPGSASPVPFPVRFPVPFPVPFPTESQSNPKDRERGGQGCAGHPWGASRSCPIPEHDLAIPERPLERRRPTATTSSAARPPRLDATPRSGQPTGSGAHTFAGSPTGTCRDASRFTLRGRIDHLAITLRDPALRAA